MVGYTPERDGLTFGISIHQHAGTAQASTADGVFPLLFEHIVRAAHLGARAASASEKRPVLMLDNGGRIVEASPAADALLRKATAVTRRDGRLVAVRPEAQAQLDALVASALGATVSGTLGGAMLLRGPNDSPGCFVRFSPWPQRNSLSGLVAPRARVEFVDLAGNDDEFDSPRFPFRLTGREAQVARLLVKGHSLHSLAECLGISYNTARVHLHALFEKTGTNRQADLVRVLVMLSK